MDEKIEIAATREDDGFRLDVFLTRHFPISRSFAARLIDEGRVMVDGSVKRPSFKLKDGMRVHGAYSLSGLNTPLMACEIPLDIIYEDPSIVVINKPAGLTVHPGAGNVGCTLVNALLAKYPEMRDVGDPNRPGIVHRLDKLTSGVMVAARSSDSHNLLVNAFKTHEHRREYMAVCYGHMPKGQGTIETFIQRNPKDRKRMTSRVDEGRKAVTHWTMIKQWKEFSLLLLSLKTGRTHQIRVHLSDMGHPVVGDAQYGGRKRANSIADAYLRHYIKALGRQMLHAALLGIIHPLTKEEMEFKSEIPEDMKELIRILDERERVILDYA
ncbi:MAG: RluA family pseudouridine synthase [Desulfomonilia bacterium]